MPDPDARRKLKSAGLAMGASMPVVFMGHLTVEDVARPMSGYLKSPGGSGSPRVRERGVDGVTDEMGLVQRTSKYGSASPPVTGGSWMDDKDRDKEKEGWLKSVKGIRSVTK
jgi:hypothetical protein